MRATLGALALALGLAAAPGVARAADGAEAVRQSEELWERAEWLRRQAARYERLGGGWVHKNRMIERSLAMADALDHRAAARLAEAGLLGEPAPIAARARPLPPEAARHLRLANRYRRIGGGWVERHGLVERHERMARRHAGLPAPRAEAPPPPPYASKPIERVLERIR